MNSKRALKTQFLSITAVLVVLALAGCAAKTNPWGDPEKGLVLRYQMPADQALKYQTSTEIVQKLEIAGNSIEVQASEISTFSAKSKGSKEDNHLLEVTIESMSLNVVSPQGEMSPDMANVNGKSFDIILSPLGKESDFSAADPIQYEITPGSKKNVLANFQTIFPNLPEEPVKVGDTWATTDTVSDRTESEEILIEFESLNKLEGFETLEGMECAKITGTVTGTFSGKAIAQGVEITSEGKTEGTETWYFAYKERIFVKMLSNVSISGHIKTPDPSNPAIPMTREHRVEIALVR